MNDKVDTHNLPDYTSATSGSVGARCGESQTEYWEDTMEEVKSGKELCEEYFERLVSVEGIDVGLGSMLKELYGKGPLTTVNVLSMMKVMREGDKNER